MDNATFTALIALGTAIATGMGVKFFDFLIALRKSKDGLNEKQFDDGVLRRQEMIKEIEYLRGVIVTKDNELAAYDTKFEKLNTDFFQLSINYTKLEGDYKGVLEKLEDLKKGITEKIDEKKDEIIQTTALNLSKQDVPPHTS